MKILLFVFFFNSFIFPDTDIHINVNKDTIFVCDKVQVNIIAKKSSILKIKFPKLNVDNQDISLSTIFSGDTSLVLSLQFWQPGNHKFPSIQIKTLSEDSIANAFSTEPIDFSILDRIEELDNDLRQSKINKKNQSFLNDNEIVLKRLGRINNFYIKDQNKPSAALVVSGDLFKIYFDENVDLNLLKENI